MVLDAHARQYTDRLVIPIARVMVRLRFTPMVMTTAGVIITGVAAYLVASGHVFVGGWVLVAGGLSDTFDGPVARLRGMTSIRGQFFDSFADRVSDAIILGAIAWLTRLDDVVFAVTLVALATALLTSYVRSKAEAMGFTCNVGWVERGERQIAVMAALVFHRWLFEPVLWALAIGGGATVGQRVVHVWRQAATRDALPEVAVHD